MRTSTRMIAIACAVAAGPLLASAAISVRDYVSAGPSGPDDDGFSLDGGGVFVDSNTSSDNTIYVYGWRWSGGDNGAGWWYWDPIPDNTGGDCSADPTRCEGDEGGPQSHEDYLNNQCELDNVVDYQAQQIMNQIKAMPDWNEREYGAVVYMVGRNIYISPLTRGETVAEVIQAGRQFPETNIQFPSDLGDGVILAIVHSHPDVGYDPNSDITNRYPSDNDYDLFDNYVGSQSIASDSRFTNNVAFAQYILGPDGIFREFNKSDGRVSSANDTIPGLRQDLWRDRPCQQ